MMIKFLVSAVLLLSPVVAFAQSLADRVPEDAVIYVGWAGAESMGPGYEESHLKAVLEASEFGKLIDEVLPRLAEKLGEQEPEAGEAMRLFSSLGAPLWKYPSAFYFGGVDFENPNGPTPRLAILCDAGDDAAGLVKELSALAEQAGEGAPFPIVAKNAGGLVVFMVGPSPPIEALLAGNAIAKPLAKNKTFLNAMTQVQKSPAATVYVDVERLMATLEQGAAMGGPEAEEMWPKVRDALGLDGVKRFILTEGFDGKDWGSRAFIAAPGPRKGLLTLMDGGPVSQEALAAIPKTATLAGAGQFDVARFYDELRNAANEVDPEAGAEFNKAVSELNKMLGMNIRKEVLGAFGPEWSFYTDPTIGGDGLFGMVLINRPKDPAATEKALLKLEQKAQAAIAKAMEGEDAPVKIEFGKTKSGKVTIHYLAVPFVTPAWAIQDGNLYIGLYPQIVAGAAKYVSGGGASIADSPKFAAIQKRLGGSAPGGFTYADLPRTAPLAYQELLMVSRLYLGMADLFGAETPAMLIPPLSSIMPHLAPAGSMSWTDEAGWHYAAIEPFPGSTSFIGGGMGAAGVGQQAMLVSIMLPALNRAREQGNRVKSASNLRMIGLAVQMHANDNKGKFPTEIGQLAKQDLTPDVFISPRSGSPAPPPGLQGNDLAKWIRANSDYVYVGAGKNFAAPADEIIAYEKPEGLTDGINVLFADGHVEFITMPQAMQMIEDAGDEDDGALQPGVEEEGL